MFSFKRSLIAFAGLSLAVALVALLTPSSTRGQGGGNQQPLNVNVVNTPAVRDADRPVRQPYSETLTRDFGSGDVSEDTEFITVPAGKALVIEHASLQARFDADDLVSARLEYRNPDTGFLVFPFLVIHRQGTSSEGERVFAASEQLRAYVQAGETVEVITDRSSAGAAEPAAVSITLSGHFVDVP
jgi:hypothetical protein